MSQRAIYLFWYSYYFNSQVWSAYLLICGSKEVCETKCDNTLIWSISKQKKSCFSFCSFSWSLTWRWFYSSFHCTRSKFYLIHQIWTIRTIQPIRQVQSIHPMYPSVRPFACPEFSSILSRLAPDLGRLRLFCFYIIFTQVSSRNPWGMQSFSCLQIIRKS